MHPRRRIVAARNEHLQGGRPIRQDTATAITLSMSWSRLEKKKKEGHLCGVGLEQEIGSSSQMRSSAINEEGGVHKRDETYELETMGIGSNPYYIEKDNSYLAHRAVRLLSFPACFTLSCSRKVQFSPFRPFAAILDCICRRDISPRFAYSCSPCCLEARCQHFVIVLRQKNSLRSCY